MFSNVRREPSFCAVVLRRADKANEPGSATIIYVTWTGACADTFRVCPRTFARAQGFCFVASLFISYLIHSSSLACDWTCSTVIGYHMIRVCLPSQSAPEKRNQEKEAHIPLRTSWISETNVSAMFDNPHKILLFDCRIDFYHGIDALSKFDQTQKQNTPLERVSQD